MRRYLIADDNRALAENVCEILAGVGHEADIAGDGSEALELLAAKRYDALVTDMRMPVVGGAELMRRLRSVDPGIATVVVTAFTTDDDLAQARRLGLLGVLPKPVAMARLLGLLERARRDALVAVVEDDMALADNVSELLRDAGFATVVASSLADAALLGARPFAAIVDMRLPGGPDGEAARALRGRFPGVPLLVVTGHDDVARPEGTAAFFRKPVPPAELIAEVERLHRARGAR